MSCLSSELLNDLVEACIQFHWHVKEIWFKRAAGIFKDVIPFQRDHEEREEDTAIDVWCIVLSTLQWGDDPASNVNSLEECFGKSDHRLLMKHAHHFTIASAGLHEDDDENFLVLVVLVSATLQQNEKNLREVRWLAFHWVVWGNNELEGLTWKQHGRLDVWMSPVYYLLRKVK